MSKAVTVNALPNASITGDATVCQNGTLTLSGGTGTTYSWNGGAFAAANTYSVNTTTAGPQTVTLIAKSAEGCESAQVSKAVTVNALPTAGANITVNTHCTAPYNGQYEITAAGGSGSGYTYSNDGTNFSATTTYGGLQTATATVYVKDGNECVSAGFPVTVSDNSANLTKFNVTGGGAYCDGSAAPSIGLDGSENGMVYTLLSGSTVKGTVTAEGAPLDFGPQAASGTYTVKVEEPGTGCGTSMNGSVTVTKNDLPTATLSGDNKLCTGADLTLTAGGGTSFNWNDAGYGTTATYVVPNTAAGTQHITLKVKDGNDCESAEISRDVVVTQQPEFIVTPAAECSDDKMKYHVELTLNVNAGAPDDPTYDYSLLGDQGAVVYKINKVSVTGDKDQPIVLTLTSKVNGDCKRQYTILAPDCSCPVVADPIGVSNAYCEGSAPVELTASASLGANEVLRWFDSATGGSQVGSDGASFLPTQAGSYYVQVVNDVDGCNSHRVEVVLTEHARPALTVTSQPTAVCAPATVNLLTAVLSETSNLSYYESNGTTPVANTSSVSGGQYKATYTDANSCVSLPVTLTATVNPLPTLFDVTGGGSYCDGGTGVPVGLSGSQTGVTYTLFFQGFAIAGQTQTGTGTAISFGDQSSDGTYTVHAEMDATGCNTDMNGSKQVAVNPNPAVPTLTSTSPSITCSEKTVTITAEASNADFAWSDTTLTDASRVIDKEGTYEVTITDRPTHCTASNQITIGYAGGEMLEGRLTANQTPVTVGGQVELTFENTSAATVNSSVWTRNGVEITGELTTLSDNPYMDYTYTIRATGDCNTVEYSVPVEVVWPTAITPYDGNGKNDGFIQHLKDDLHLIIYDRFGNKVYEGDNGWDATINGKLAMPGVYYYHVTLNEVGDTKRGTIEVYK